MTFESLALSPETMKAIKEMGFTKPTPIQLEAIPLLMQGVDLIGQAQTGSGKTAAFGIYIIEHIDKAQRKPQALILTPTRELAVQVSEEIRKLGKHHHNLSVVTIYGGASLNVQADELRRGAHIVVGTPGRIIDMIDRRALQLGAVEIAVLDEADRMLDMGFIDDVRFIIEKTPKTRQTLLFSATMPGEIRELANRYMKNPESLTLSTDAVPIDKIKQSYILVERRNKFTVLLNILRLNKPELALVFVRTKIEADRLSHHLNKEKFNSIALHGNLSQNQRDRAMHSFRHGHVGILVATDIAARGIDVSGITHVINFDLPVDPNTYAHRVGRTARAGAHGKAISLVTPEQNIELRDVQRSVGIRLERENIEGAVTGEWFSEKSSEGSHTGYSQRGYGGGYHSRGAGGGGYQGRSQGHGGYGQRREGASHGREHGPGERGRAQGGHSGEHRGREGPSQGEHERRAVYYYKGGKKIRVD